MKLPDYMATDTEKKRKMPLWLGILVVIFLFAGWIWFVVHKSAPPKQEDHSGKVE